MHIYSFLLNGQVKTKVALCSYFANYLNLKNIHVNSTWNSFLFGKMKSCSSLCSEGFHVRMSEKALNDVINLTCGLKYDFPVGPF